MPARRGICAVAAVGVLGLALPGPVGAGAAPSASAATPVTTTPQRTTPVATTPQRTTPVATPPRTTPAITTPAPSTPTAPSTTPGTAPATTPGPFTPSAPSTTPGTTPTTPLPTTPPPSDPVIIPFDFDLTGSAVLRSLIWGTLPIKGTVSTRIDLVTGNFTADLTVERTGGHLIAFGFLPVWAGVELEPAAPLTGRLRGGVLSVNAKFNVRLPSVQVLGIQLAGGANCRTKQVSSVELASTQTYFRPLTGGPVAGTFAMTDLVDCGPLTRLFSPLTAGRSNAIAGTLKPRF